MEVGHNLVPAISRRGDPVCDRLGNTENGVRSLTDKVSAEMESVRQLISFHTKAIQFTTDKKITQIYPVSN